MLIEHQQEFSLNWMSDLEQELAKIDIAIHPHNEVNLADWRQIYRFFRIDFSQAIIQFVNQFEAYTPTFNQWLASNRHDTASSEIATTLLHRLQHRACINHQNSTQLYDKLHVLATSSRNEQVKLRLLNCLKNLRHIEIFWQQWEESLTAQQDTLLHLTNRFILSGFARKLKQALIPFQQLRQHCENIQNI